MSGDDSDTEAAPGAPESCKKPLFGALDSSEEAVIKALDRWYSKKVNDFYNPDVALFIHRNVTKEAASLPPREHQQLEADFVWTFPSRAFPCPWEGFFSCRYERFEGYFRNACDSSGNSETREMQTIVPAHAVRETCTNLVDITAELAEGRSMPDVGEEIIDEAFKSVFRIPTNFAGFSMGYLNTRVLSASLRTSCAKMTHPEYAMRRRNYSRVCAYVELFSETVFGDILH